MQLMHRGRILKRLRWHRGVIITLRTRHMTTAGTLSADIVTFNCITPVNHLQEQFLSRIDHEIRYSVILSTNHRTLDQGLIWKMSFQLCHQGSKVTKMTIRLILRTEREQEVNSEEGWNRGACLIIKVVFSSVTTLLIQPSRYEGDEDVSEGETLFPHFFICPPPPLFCHGPIMPQAAPSVWWLPAGGRSEDAGAHRMM